MINDDIRIISSFNESTVPYPLKEIVIVKGNWHEMGVQYANQATEALKLVVSETLSMHVKRTGCLKKVYEKAVAQRAVIEDRAPELISLWSGMADAIGVDLETIMIGQLKFNCPEDCSSISVWGKATKDGRMLTGSNHDRDYYGTMYEPVVIAYPEEGNAFISSAGFEPHCVMNCKGLVLTNSGSRTALPGDMNYGLPSMPSMMIAAARCNNTDEAREAVIRGLRSGGGVNTHISDESGNDCIIESTSLHYAVRRAGDFGEDDYSAAANCYKTEEMKKSHPADETPLFSSYHRYSSEEKIILENYGNIGVREVNKALSCRRYFSGGTWSNIVWDPYGDNTTEGSFTPEKRTSLFKCVARDITDPQNKTMYCMRGCTDKLISPAPFASGSFVKVILGSSPGETLKQMKKDVEICIYLAAEALSGNTANAESRAEAHEKAKAFLFEANNFGIKSTLAADEDESLCLAGKSATAYSRARTAAQSVCSEENTGL